MLVIKSFRLHTLPAALIPIVSAWLIGPVQQINTTFFFVLSCLVASFIQISTNIFNDLLDFDRGLDTHREDRNISSSKKTRSEARVWALIFLFLSFILGMNFVKLHWIYFPVGIISLYLSYGYTGGRFPLAYNGLGEVFSFVFFGLVIVLGSYFSMYNQIDSKSIVLSFLCGMHSSLLMMFNNFRDFKTDSLGRKNTLAVKVGEKNFVGLIKLNLLLMNFTFCLFIDSFFLRGIYVLFHFSLFFYMKIDLNHKKRVEVFKFSILSYILFLILVVSSIL